MSRLPTPRHVARSLVYAVTGGGRELLDHKRSYHARRAAAEARVLAEARRRAEVLVDNACPACDGRAVARRFTSPIGFRFAECAADGAIYMDPVPSDETLAALYGDDAYAYEWLRGRRPAARAVNPTHRDELAALVRLRGRAGGRLLDVGCATGGFLLTAARAGFAAEGIELSDATAAVGRQHGLAIRTGSLADLPAGARFDVITMLQLVEHVVRPVELLAQARARLAEGGVIYLATPNIDSGSFAYLGRHHVHVSSFGHVSLLGRRALEAVAARAGLSVTAHEYCMGHDLALHDVLTFALARPRFRHRMALYRPRLYHACNFLDALTLGAVGRVIAPGHASYQRALLRATA